MVGEKGSHYPHMQSHSGSIPLSTLYSVTHQALMKTYCVTGLILEFECSFLREQDMYTDNHSAMS